MICSLSVWLTLNFQEFYLCRYIPYQADTDVDYSIRSTTRYRTRHLPEDHAAESFEQYANIHRCMINALVN